MVARTDGFHRIDVGEMQHGYDSSHLIIAGYSGRRRKGFPAAIRSSSRTACISAMRPNCTCSSRPCATSRPRMTAMSARNCWHSALNRSNSAREGGRLVLDGTARAPQVQLTDDRQTNEAHRLKGGPWLGSSKPPTPNHADAALG